MNYLRVYCNLIRKAENRTPPDGYIEKHHIFPVSIFGNNKRIVVLTSREHYIAHALLEKIYIKRYGLHHYKTHKMTHAHCMMKGSRRYTNSYLYEGTRIRRSELMKGNTYTLGKTLSEEHKRKLSESQKGKSNLGKIPWNKGQVGLQIAWNKGKPLSEETKAKVSAAKKGKKGKPLSEEQKRNLSETRKGENNPMYGKTASEETKAKMSESQRKGRAGTTPHAYNPIHHQP